jgi:pimeloyl-ACP methyl ester carboxylesterase
MIVRSKDGTPIETLVSGDGPPLLLVHGTSGDATRWPAVVPGLGEHFTVHSMNRRGRGGSIDGDAPYAIEREGEDIAAVLEALGSSVCLLAHSYGALCSLETLLLTSGIERAILYEPPVPTGTPVYPAGIAAKIEALVASGDRDEAVATFFRDVFLLSAQQIDTMRSFPSWEGRVAAAHTLAREIRATDRWAWNAERFAEVDVPIRLFVGGNSIPIAHEMTNRLASGLRGSNIVELRGQMHVAMDTGPNLFVREALAFLCT